MKFTTRIKLLSALLLILCFAQQTKAQTTNDQETKNYDQGFRLGFGISGGYVFQKPYQSSLGGDIRLQYNLSKRYSIALTTGYTNLFVSGKDLGFIPVKAGYKTFVWENKFYAMGEIGAAIAMTNGYHKTSLLIAPSVGYATDYIDINLRFERYADFPKPNDDGSAGQGVGQIALRFAYGFRL